MHTHVVKYVAPIYAYSFKHAHSTRQQLWHCQTC